MSRRATSIARRRVRPKSGVEPRAVLPAAAPRRERGLWAVLLLTALYISPYWMVFGGRAVQIENDFDCLYYRYKAYLLDALAFEQRIPLWSPSEAAGVPFYSNPFAATCYPLNLPLAVFYRMAGGYTQHDHKVFTSLGVLILSAGLYLWLRSLRLPVLASVFAAVVAGCSMKVTELMRLPNALHAAAWLPWFLYGINRIVDGSGRWRGAVAIAGATILVLTAGYPYYAYYLQFLIGPYLLVVLVPKLRDALWYEPPEQACGWRTAIMWLGGAFAAGLAVCMPYLVHLKAFLDQMQDRGGGDYAYATEHNWDLFLDTAGSLVYPPAAMAEGWYYFGVAGLLIVVVYGVHVLAGARGRTSEQVLDSGEPNRRELWFAGGALAAYIVLTYLTLGRESYLFQAMWSAWPGFSRLRVWPRMNILLVPLIAVVLARAAARWRLFDYSVPPVEAGRDRNPATRSIVRGDWIVATYVLVLGVQLVFWSFGYAGPYYATYFAHGPFAPFGPGWFLRSGAIAFLAVLAAWGLHQRGLIDRPTRAIGLMAGLVLVTMADVGPLGLSQWVPVQLGYVGERSPLFVSRMVEASLTIPRRFERDTIQIYPSFNVGIVPNWYFEEYVDFLERSGLDHERPEKRQNAAGQAAWRLLGCVDGRRLYVTRTVEHATAEALLADADALAAATPTHVEVTHYDGDELVAKLDSPTGGFLCFIDNWDPDWRAELNGSGVPLLRVLGTFKAMAIPAGQSQIRFAYRPLD